MSCGIVPAWGVTLTLFKKPKLLKNKRMIVLMVGLALFVILLSPFAFGLEKVFLRAPVISVFYFPFRGIPAFHVLIIVLFVTLSKRINYQVRVRRQLAILGLCLIGSGAFFYSETSISALSGLQSWYRINTASGDGEELKPDTLNILRKSWYVLNLVQDGGSRDNAAYMTKPRLFLSGNMGTQYGVRTVHHYMTAIPDPAYKALGMNYHGEIHNFEAVKRFLEVSPRRRPHEELSWDDGMAPRDFDELAKKTYVGAIIVETKWQEVLNYFRYQRAWSIVEANPWCTVLVHSETADK
jgi:hypothetical protein